METSDITETDAADSGVNPVLVGAAVVTAFVLTRPLRRELKVRLRTRLARAQRKYEDTINTTATEK